MKKIPLLVPPMSLAAPACAVLRVEVEVPDDLAPSLRGPRQGDTMHV